MFEEKNTGTTCRRRSSSTRPTATSTTSCSWPRAAARRTRATSSRRPRRCSTRRASLAFLEQKLRSLGTAACPPYHLAIVIGGTSAEHTLKIAKLASARYLDELPTSGNALGPRASATSSSEQKVARDRARDRHRRAVRRQVLLPRRARDPPAAPRRVLPGRASPSRCSADRQALGKITRDGVFLEQLETDPAKYLPEITHARARAARS